MTEELLEECPTCEGEGIVQTAIADFVALCPDCEGACYVKHACGDE